MEEAVTAVQNPLVAITFQKNIDRKKKYLEAEPKALGVPSVKKTGPNVDSCNPRI